MSIIRPTRRELLTAIPLLVGGATLSSPLFGRTEDRPANFLVVGDWGRDGRHNQTAVAGRMSEQAELRRPAFIASTGDNFYTLGVSSIDDRQWRTSFEDIYQGALSGIDWYPVLGNHDYGGNVVAQLRYPGARWKMDQHTKLEERRPYYRESISSPGGGRADLFFIDTVMWAGREAFPFSFLGSEISAVEQREQARWLHTQLSTSDAPFKFVFGHHGIHSIGPHGGTMQMAQLDDLLRQHGVTAYVHGHDHCLFHIRNRGMSYICSGGGSQVLATYHGGHQEPGCVYSGFCNEGGRSEAPFPIWLSFIRDAGFASFDLYADRVEFDLFGLNPGPSSRHHFVLAPTSRAHS